MHNAHINLIGGLFLILFVSCFIFAPSYGVSSLASILISSKNFQDNGMIPAQHTCAGSNTSPHLKWSNIPPQTKSFVLMCHDPDAPGGDWVHWILYNIPASVTELEENFQPQKICAVGINSWGKKEYSGPCPPVNNGKHHYIFTLYALNSMLTESDQEVIIHEKKVTGFTRAFLEQAIIDKKIGSGKLVGRFERTTE